MHFSTSLVSLLVAVSAAPASPVASPDAQPAGELVERDNTIRVCTGSNWDGNCVSFSPAYNQCYPFSALGLSGYQSFGPSSGTYCIWYDGDACSGTGSGTVTYPGWAPVPGYWVYNTRSFKCWW